MTRGSQGRGRAGRFSIVVMWGVTSGLCAVSTAQTSAPGTAPGNAPPAAAPIATDVALAFAGKSTVRSKIEAQLSAPVREALDRWTEPVKRLELGIALGERPEHIVIGHAPLPTLVDAAEWMDQAFDLLDPLVPVAEGHSAKATVAILMDEDGVSSEAWDGVLAELEAQKQLIPGAADYLRSHVEGLTLRQTPLFLQPTFDVAGGGEFRLGNEVVHKYAQCLLTVRTGQQPAQLLWGLGYVVEEQLFDSAYHFNVAAFVYTADHADWRTRTRDWLDKHRGDKQFSLAATAADEESAGRAVPKQMVTWASLSYLSQKQPKRLREMLGALAVAQAEADPSGVWPMYRGDPAKTGEILKSTLDAIELKELSAWLKKGR